MKKALGIVIGMIVGMIVVFLVEMISAGLYPAPTSLDFADPESVKAWVATLPIGAFLIVLAAHVLGAFTGGLVCGRIVGKWWLPGPLIIGLLFLIAGALNLSLIPHPVWFMIVDVLVYIPAAFAGAKLASRFFHSKPSTMPDDQV